MMSCSCCTTEETPARTAACPGCGQHGELVTLTTLLHQLVDPWRQSRLEEAHYFCNQRDCDVVYFSAQGDRIYTSQLRSPPGQKSGQPDRFICYCFDIRQQDLQAPDEAQRLRQFVIDMTRDKLCACESRNPSGRCCLRDFPREKE